jgi:phage-related tail fiber protein
MSKLQVDEIVNKEDTSSVAFPRGAVVTGVATATTFDGNLTGNATTATTATTATNAVNAQSGSALEASINSKTSPGKAIALSMVFG